MLTVVLATRNAGKRAELSLLFSGLGISLVSIPDVLPDDFVVHEDGDTFEANAILKARAVCKASNLMALADDSGLEVDALGGRPGVRSARFAHDRATDAENNAALLRELEAVDEDALSARFRCVLALASPWEQDVIVVEGRCEGSIARTPRGSGGFGYDPLFIVTGQDGRAMAELSEQQKNLVSHRGRAAAAMLPELSTLVSRRMAEAQRTFG
jgi:XTP/dITP diphosphohydrolase